MPEERDLLWCIGPPLPESLATLAGSPEAGAEALVHYRERFGTVGLFENAVYPGIPELLAELGGQGRRLYVATSKPLVYAERILERFGLARFFLRAFGAELDGVRGRKPDLLAYALAETGVAPSEAIMIGDRRHDVEAARAHGLASIGVLYGYGSETELREAGAGRLAATVEALGVLLSQGEQAAACIRPVRRD